MIRVASRRGGSQTLNYYKLAEGRFLLYMKRRNEAQAKTQLERMQENAAPPKSDSINQTTTFIQAAFDHSSGNTQAGDATLQTLVVQFSGNKQYE